MMTDVIECPKCGKNTLVQCHADLYHCISCDFEKDLSEKPQDQNVPDPPAPGGGILPLLILVVLVFALF